MTKTFDREEHMNNIIFQELIDQNHQLSLVKAIKFSVLVAFFLMIAAVSSHLKVHRHSSICSFLSDQGDWHKMVSSS